MAFEVEADELERIREENDGLLTVSAIVEAAKDEDSPLHKHFDWDDTHAAEKYREWQARTLIQKCKITVENKPDTLIRAYVSVPLDRKAGGYRAVHEVLDDAVLRESLMREMRMRIAYWQKQHYLLDAETQRALNLLENVLTQPKQAELRAG